MATLTTKTQYRLWVSCHKFTVCVTVDRKTGLITDAASIIQKFINQPFNDLERWMASLGDYQWHELENY